MNTSYFDLDAWISKKLKNNSNENRIFSRAEKAIALCLITILFTCMIYRCFDLFRQIKIEDTQSYIERLDTKAEQIFARSNNFECYFDGNKIDINNVSLSQYKCDIDLNNKRVYLTYRGY